MTINIIDRMIYLSKDKEKYLKSILMLTKDQKTFIQNEDMDGINNIISQKEKLMSAIDLLDIQFLSLYKEVKDLEDINSISELQENISNINILLSDISVIDKENTHIMKKNLQNIKHELRNVKEVKKAYKGYNYEGVHSILIDEKK